jgi:peptide chain release factor 1
MRVLRARLYEAQRQRQDAAVSSERRASIGSGDRHERVRTYNFPQVCQPAPSSAMNPSHFLSFPSLPLTMVLNPITAIPRFHRCLSPSAQNRITDHRVGITLHGLDEIMAGEAEAQQGLDRIMDALAMQEQTELLEAMSAAEEAATGGG